MLTFLEYSGVEEIYHHIRVAHDLPLAVLFAPSRAITKSSLAEWAELNTLGAGSLFQETPQIHLVDISGVRISADLKSFRFDPADPVYLYHPEEHKLNAPERKLLKQAGIEYEKTTKLTSALVRTYAEEFLKNHQTLTPNVLNLVLQEYQTLPEVVNVLSVLETPGLDPKTYLQAIRQTEAPKLYLSDYRPGQRGSLQTWYEHVPEADVQLALSLIHTKLTKYNRDPARIRDVVETDRLIKTNTQGSPLTWYRLMLWKAWRQI